MRVSPSSRKEATWYLAALIDGEGSVQFAKRARGSSRSVQIANTDPDILDAARTCLKILDVPYREYDRLPEGNFGGKLRTYITIASRTGLEALRGLPIQAASKREALAKCIESYAPRLPPPAELVARYDSGMTIDEIAESLGVSFGTIQGRLVQAGYTPRSGAPRKDPPIPRERLVEMYERLGSLARMSEETGVSVGSLAYWMQKLDIPRKRAGRPEGRGWSPDERRQRERSRS